MKTKKQLEKLLGENRTTLRTAFYVKEVGLFGSFVKGFQHQHSDVDLLVEFQKGHKDFFNYMRLKHYLEELLGRRVDLVMKRAIKPRLREQILRGTEYV